MSSPLSHSHHEHAGLSTGDVGQPVHSDVGAIDQGRHTVVGLPAALSNRNAVGAVMSNDTDREVRVDGIARIVAAVTDPCYHRPVPPSPVTAAQVISLAKQREAARRRTVARRRHTTAVVLGAILLTTAVAGVVTVLAAS